MLDVVHVAVHLLGTVLDIDDSVKHETSAGNRHHIIVNIVAVVMESLVKCWNMPGEFNLKAKSHIVKSLALPGNRRPQLTSFFRSSNVSCLRKVNASSFTLLLRSINLFERRVAADDSFASISMGDLLRPDPFDCFLTSCRGSSTSIAFSSGALGSPGTFTPSSASLTQSLIFSAFPVILHSIIDISRRSVEASCETSATALTVLANKACKVPC
jgi:hypothetical protein